jgi:hypothetical protein
MKNASIIRRLLYSVATVALLIFCVGSIASAQKQGTNSGGVGRGDEGQIVRVTVMRAARLVRGIRVRVKSQDGTVVASGLTGKTGTYSVPLNAGSYTISVTSHGVNATSPVTVVKSTDPALITLTLAPPIK